MSAWPVASSPSSDQAGQRSRARARRRPPRPRATSPAGRAWCRPDAAAGRRPPARRGAGRRRRSRRCPRRRGRGRRAARRRSHPATTSSSRPAARSRNSSSGPYWIDSVGHAWAHAGVMPFSGAVVAQRALPHPPVVLDLAAVEHPERARRDAVAAAVADVLLDDHRSELGADDRPGRAHVEAGRVRAVLAHVRAHQPAEAVAAAVSCPGRRAAAGPAR